MMSTQPSPMTDEGPTPILATTLPVKHKQIVEAILVIDHRSRHQLLEY
jgi:hypothetical protein